MERGECGIWRCLTRVHVEDLKTQMYVARVAIGNDDVGKKKRRRRKRSERPSHGKASTKRPLTDELKDQIEEWAEEACEVTGVDLIDVAYATPGRWHLQVFAQRPGNPGPGEGINVDELAEISRYVEALLDAEDRVPENYLLEVSSPGIERDLKKPKHFRQAAGATIRVVLREAIDGVYAFEGELHGIDEAEEVVTITFEGDDEPRAIAYDTIKQANITYDFDASGK